MFYILFFVSYIFASNEVAGACVAIHEHLMEVSGHFCGGRQITVHSPIGSYPTRQCIPMANQIKSILCTRFFNVSKNKLPERIEACMESINLNLEFMSSFDTANAAAAQLIKDAHVFLN